jgi:hypothetical protein
MMTSPFSTTSSLSVDDQRRWAWGILIALAAWASAVAALGAAGLFAKLPLPLWQRLSQSALWLPSRILPPYALPGLHARGTH